MIAVCSASDTDALGDMGAARGPIKAPLEGITAGATDAAAGATGENMSRVTCRLRRRESIPSLLPAVPSSLTAAVARTSNDLIRRTAISNINSPRQGEEPRIITGCTLGDGCCM